MVKHSHHPMRIAIMQPYLFPYVGYFQMVNAVDKFIFYDDVNYIKGGWINRNRILINHAASYFTVELKNASVHKLIRDVEIGNNVPKLLKTISMAYKKAPFYNSTWPIIESILSSKHESISDLAIRSVVDIAAYLDVPTEFERSSEKYGDTKPQERADRLISMCKQNNAHHYINAIGGMEIYTKEYFAEHGIKLDFIQPKITPYKQFNNDFIPGLSIIDVLMFNDKEKIKDHFKEYSFVIQ